MYNICVKGCCIHCKSNSFWMKHWPFVYAIYDTEEMWGILEEAFVSCSHILDVIVILEIRLEIVCLDQILKEGFEVILVFY